MANIVKGVLSARTKPLAADLGLLFLRLGVGFSMAYQHGWPKLKTMLDSGAPEGFDPIGLGPTVSFALTIFAEFFCSILLACGLLTRLAVFPLFFTMCVAFFVHHASDPFKAKELAFVYLVVYLTLLVAGAGRFSLDGFVQRMKKG